MTDDACYLSRSFHIENYENSYLNIGSILVKGLNIGSYEEKDTFIILLDGIHKNNIQIGNDVLFGNLKLNEFIKNNKIYTNSDIKLLEKWFNQNEHKIVNMGRNNKKIHEDYIDYFEIYCPISYNLLTGYPLEKDNFNFIYNNKELFKKSLLNMNINSNSIKVYYAK